MNLDFAKNKIEIQLLNWARTMNWMNNYGFQFFNIQAKDAISKKLYQTWESKRNNCLMRPFRLLLITNTTFSVKTQLNVQFSGFATCCEGIFDKENVFLICFSLTKHNLSSWGSQFRFIIKSKSQNFETGGQNKAVLGSFHHY